MVLPLRLSIRRRRFPRRNDSVGSSAADDSAIRTGVAVDARGEIAAWLVDWRELGQAFDGSGHSRGGFGGGRRCVGENLSVGIARPARELADRVWEATKR